MQMVDLAALLPPNEQFTGLNAALITAGCKPPFKSDSNIGTQNEQYDFQLFQTQN